jgi:hypothetical protein
MLIRLYQNPNPNSNTFICYIKNNSENWPWGKTYYLKNNGVWHKNRWPGWDDKCHNIIYNSRRYAIQTIKKYFPDARIKEIK